MSGARRYKPSSLERANELYEFQIFIFAPREKALQRNARIFAAMKILEQIERSVFPVSAHETN
jgi:hypothetical protein